MSPFKILLAASLITLTLYSTDGVAATVTSCYKKVCAIITAPDQVGPEEEFEVQVEGYIENATDWDISAYMLLENAQWNYSADHMLDYSGDFLDAKGFNWGANLVKKYRFKGLDETKVLTFVFGSRSWEHGYYDVAVEASVEAASPAIDIAFDIKPQSCPNPLNASKKGLLSAAIVGTSDFDVSHVDPATIQLAGVPPVHFSYEDVTEPYYPLTEKISELDCTDAGPDGYLDLTLKFRAQDVYAALQNLQDRPLLNGETLTVKMTGALSDAGGQKPQASITGEDVLRIKTRK